MALDSTEQLIKTLADGKFHSGQALGDLLGVSRAAVWKRLQGLSELGLDVQSIKGKGYCLSSPVSLFDKARLHDFVEQQSLSEVVVLGDVDSTNAYLMQQLSQGQPLADGMAVVAEYQSGGRGRRGRQWLSPYGKNLYLSKLVSFERGMSELDGLSLVVGISVVQALAAIGVDEAKLKWPNDVLYHDKKLAGILLEITGDPSGLCQVVIGVGMNINMHDAGGAIDQPWVSLSQVLGECVDKNTVLEQLLLALEGNLAQFKQSGFASFLKTWHEYDAFVGRQVVLHMGQKQLMGEYQGVNDGGELLLEVNGAQQAFNGGEVSLRKQ